MKLGIKFCGGCNPYIDRKLLIKRLREILDSEQYLFKYFNFDDCDMVLVINGCNVACSEAPPAKKTITVSGLEVEGKACREEILASEVARKILNGSELKTTQF